MGRRRYPVVPDKIYHVFNRSIAREPIFLNKREYLRFKDLLIFYSHTNLPGRYSRFNNLPIASRAEIFTQIQKNPHKVTIYAYCLMVNHFHIVIRGLGGNNLSSFISNIQNSHAKYFNKKAERTGGLFQAMFKAVEIETNEQFSHVVRYVHLNPYTSGVVNNQINLESYPWSSLNEYLSDNYEVVSDPDLLKGIFSNNIQSLKQFTLDNADYQKNLHLIQHLVSE